MDPKCSIMCLPYPNEPNSKWTQNVHNGPSLSKWTQSVHNRPSLSKRTQSVHNGPRVSVMGQGCPNVPSQMCFSVTSTVLYFYIHSVTFTELPLQCYLHRVTSTVVLSQLYLHSVTSSTFNVLLPKCYLRYRQFYLHSFTSKVLLCYIHCATSTVQSTDLPRQLYFHSVTSTVLSTMLPPDTQFHLHGVIWISVFRVTFTDYGVNLHNVTSKILPLQCYFHCVTSTVLPR